MIVLLENNEGLTEDVDLVKLLKSKYKIYCKPIGLSKKSKNNAQFYQPPFLCDQYSMAFIYQNKICEIQASNLEKLNDVIGSVEYKIFHKLKSEYFLINNKKFGGIFLAYLKDPQTQHADCIIFNEGNIISMSRLATICQKKCIFMDEFLNRYQVTLIK